MNGPRQRFGTAYVLAFSQGCQTDHCMSMIGRPAVDPIDFVAFGSQHLTVVAILSCLRKVFVGPIRIDIIDIAKGNDLRARLFADTLYLTMPHTADTDAGNLNRLTRRHVSGAAQDRNGYNTRGCNSAGNSHKTATVHLSSTFHTCSPSNS
ncbi:hypothetical protein ES703_120801 [subsurface metagenome]